MNNRYQEQDLFVVNGWGAVIFELIILFIIAVILFLGGQTLFNFIFAGGLLILFIFVASGFFVLQPNTAMVTTFFGSYNGSHKEDGFFWNNPLNSKIKVGLKVHTHSTPIIKVNDKSGNPVEVACAVFWQIEDTAAALFAVEDYEDFLRTQSEAILRKIVSNYSYDSKEVNEVSLKTGTHEVGEKLGDELQDRVNSAGIRIREVRLTHVAYAPEIAQAMLRRQQAEAVVMARQRIVDGAVGMVESVLDQIEKKKLAQYDNDSKVTLINNLMTVLVSESEAQPMISLDSSHNKKSVN